MNKVKTVAQAVEELVYEYIETVTRVHEQLAATIGE